jgi:uncharacterized protein YndB with AHSA1/START domain
MSQRRRRGDADGKGFAMASQPDELTVHLHSVVDTRPPRVFAALTDPDQLAHWWGPHGFTTSVIELDLRVGGKYRFAMQPPDGEPFHLHGELREVEAPFQLAYTFRWEPPDPQDVDTVVHISLTDLGGRTRITVDQGVFATEARTAVHEEGWTESLERLKAFLSSKRMRDLP